MTKFVSNFLFGKNKAIKIWICRLRVVSLETRYSYGVQFGINCTALDQSKLSNCWVYYKLNNCTTNWEISGTPMAEIRYFQLNYSYYGNQEKISGYEGYARVTKNGGRISIFLKSSRFKN